MDKLAGRNSLQMESPLVGQGPAFIATGKPYPKVMEESFAEDTPDHRILAITITLQKYSKTVL